MPFIFSPTGVCPERRISLIPFQVTAIAGSGRRGRDGVSLNSRSPTGYLRNHVVCTKTAADFKLAWCSVTSVLFQLEGRITFFLMNVHLGSDVVSVLNVNQGSSNAGLVLERGGGELGRGGQSGADVHLH